MSRLNELKEKYAVQQGFDSWKELWFDTTDFKHANERIDELVKLYAKECSQASLEKASETSQMNFHDGHLKTNTLTSYFMTGADSLKVSKESITSPENIILL